MHSAQADSAQADSAPAYSLTRLTQYLPFRDVNQFFDDLPQNTMLVGTALAICGVVYSILTLSVYLFIQNAVLTATTYYAYKKLCEAASMQENLDQFQASNTEQRRIIVEMGEHEVEMGKGLIKLGKFQQKLEDLRSLIAQKTEELREIISMIRQENAEHKKLNARNLKLVQRHEQVADRLYGRGDDVV